MSAVSKLGMVKFYENKYGEAGNGGYDLLKDHLMTGLTDQSLSFLAEFLLVLFLNSCL